MKSVLLDRNRGCSCAVVTGSENANKASPERKIL